MYRRRSTLKADVVGLDAFANVLDVVVRNVEAVTPFLEGDFAVAIGVAPDLTQ